MAGKTTDVDLQELLQVAEDQAHELGLAPIAFLLRTTLKHFHEPRRIVPELEDEITLGGIVPVDLGESYAVSSMEDDEDSGEPQVVYFDVQQGADGWYFGVVWDDGVEGDRLVEAEGPFSTPKAVHEAAYEHAADVIRTAAYSEPDPFDWEAFKRAYNMPAQPELWEEED